MSDFVFDALAQVLTPELRAWFFKHRRAVEAAMFRAVRQPSKDPLRAERQVYAVKKAVMRWDKEMSAQYDSHDIRAFKPEDAGDLVTLLLFMPGVEVHFLRLGIDYTRAEEIVANLLRNKDAQAEPAGTVFWTTAPVAFDFRGTWRDPVQKQMAHGAEYQRIVIEDPKQVQHQIDRNFSGGYGTMSEQEMQDVQARTQEAARFAPIEARMDGMRREMEHAAKQIPARRDSVIGWRIGVPLVYFTDSATGRVLTEPDNTPGNLAQAHATLERLLAEFRKEDKKTRDHFSSLGADLSALQMIAKHQHAREMSDAQKLKRKKEQKQEQLALVAKRLEAHGLGLGVYVVDVGQTLEGKVTAWPPTTEFIKTNMGDVPIFGGSTVRDISGVSLHFDVPKAVLKLRPLKDIAEIVWQGQRFFSWRERHTYAEIVVAENGRRLPKDSEKLRAVLAALTYSQDDEIDNAVLKLQETAPLQDWTPLTLPRFGKTFVVEVRAPARRTKGLLGYQIRMPNGALYSRQSKPKNGHLWVLQ